MGVRKGGGEVGQSEERAGMRVGRGGGYGKFCGKWRGVGSGGEEERGSMGGGVGKGQERNKAGAARGGEGAGRDGEGVGKLVGRRWRGGKEGWGDMIRVGSAGGWIGKKCERVISGGGGDSGEGGESR